MGCSDREPDTGSVEPTSVGEMPALDLTPVSEMSLGKGDLTGLFCGNYASGRTIAHH
jgi:hypothetical protein